MVFWFTLIFALTFPGAEAEPLRATRDTPRQASACREFFTQIIPNPELRWSTQSARAPNLITPQRVGRGFVVTSAGIYLTQDRSPDPYPPEKMREIHAAMNQLYARQGRLSQGFSWGEFFLRSEFLEEPKPTEAARARMLREYQRHLTAVREMAAKESNSWTRIEDIRRYAQTHFTKTYCESSARLSDYWLNLCGNCAAETRLFTALLADAEVEPPYGYRFGTQWFYDHMQPVLFRDSPRDVINLVSGERTQETRGPVYDPRVILQAWLKKQNMNQLDFSSRRFRWAQEDPLVAADRTSAQGGPVPEEIARNASWRLGQAEQRLQQLGGVARRTNTNLARLSLGASRNAQPPGRENPSFANRRRFSSIFSQNGANRPRTSANNEEDDDDDEANPDRVQQNNGLNIPLNPLPARLMTEEELSRNSSAVPFIITSEINCTAPSALPQAGWSIFGGPQFLQNTTPGAQVAATPTNASCPGGATREIVLFRSQQHLDTYNRASRREKLEFLVNRVRLASQVIVEDSGATQVLSFLGSRSRYEELFSVSDSEMRSLQHFARDTSALREAGRVLELYERRFHRGRQRAQLGTLISEIIDLESRVFSFAHRNSNLDFKAEARLFLQELDRATPERRAMMLEAFFHSGGVGFTAFRTAVVQLLENPNETRVRAPVVRPNEVAIDISLEGVPPPPVTSPPMAEPPENPENSPQRPQISARILMSAEAMAQSMVGTFRFGGYRSYPGIRFEADLLSALESELVNLPADSSRIFLDDPFRRNRFASERDFLQPSGEFRRRWIVPPDRIDSSLAQDRLVALVRRVPGQSLPEPILDDLNDPLLLPERMANFYRNTVFRNESAIEFLPTLDSQDLPMGTRLNFGQNQYKSEILAAIFDQTGFLPFGFSCGNLRSPDWDKCTRTNNGQRVELVEVFERILERLSGFTMRYQINATPACKFFHSYHLLEAAIRGMPQETRTRAAARDPIFQRELALIERYGQRGPNPNVEEMCRTL